MLFSLGLLRRIARELPRYGKPTYCLYRDPRVPQLFLLPLAIAAGVAIFLFAMHRKARHRSTWLVVANRLGLTLEGGKPRWL